MSIDGQVVANERILGKGHCTVHTLGGLFVVLELVARPSCSPRAAIQRYTVRVLCVQGQRKKKNKQKIKIHKKKKYVVALTTVKYSPMIIFPIEFVPI